MTLTRLFRVLLLCPLLLIMQHSWAQTKTVSGKVTDEKGSPVTGASVLLKGAKSGTQTDASGNFTINVPPAASTLTITYVGYASQDVNITNETSVSVSLVASSSSGLNDVVVIGYGTARRKDLTGAVSSVQAKDFNQGVVAAPDELIQGKVPGLLVTVGGGQPGGATIVKIRGTNSIASGTAPLYVIDGVILDGGIPIPSLGSVSGLGNLPGSDPLLFVNPNDIASIDVLKDASASAIYGSRGANGVILITTKRGQSGISKIDVSASVGTSGLMKQPNILDASQYRSELGVYGFKSDSGQSVDPFKSITQHGVTQNYNVSFTGGNENGKYRASFLASNQEGIIKSSGLQKYLATFGGDYKFLDQKLSITFNMTASDVIQQFPPISNDAGSTGNLISAAMNWNPTLALSEGGIYNQTNPSGQINPDALLAAYYDKVNVAELLGSITAGYKIFPWLEYRILYGVNYGSGLRDNELQGWIKGTGGNADAKGEAAIGDARLYSQTLTHTLNFTKDIAKNLNLSAIVGYEYYSSDYRNQTTNVFGFNYNLSQTSLVSAHYFDNMQDGVQANLRTSTGVGPVQELQSEFARAQFNYMDRYELTATFRSDGSSKFGANNRYAYFPSFGAAWNIANESFMKGNKIFSQLKIRGGYGETGNQSFPAGLAQVEYNYSANGSVTQTNQPSPDLKWESVKSIDAGLEFAILHSRIYGSFDYYHKRTTDPIYPFPLSEDAPTGAVVWKNLPGYIQNQGLELGLGAAVVQTKDFTWNIHINAAYNKNLFSNAALGKSPLVLTGAVTGQGVSNTFVQAIANGQPIDVFYLRQFTGFDKNGIATVASQASSFSGDPDPHFLLGISTDFNYKKLSLTLNMHGAFGNKIFNNTLVSVTNLGNISNGKNIAASLIGSPESLANPVSASTRFLESGNYMKMGNATLRYSFGAIGKTFKAMTVYVTGANLFEITKYTGFDAEVNVDHSNAGIPSEGIDYIGYPTARTFTFGVNFSL